MEDEMAKKNSIEIDFGSLEADLRKYANNVCRNAASEIADELTKEARLGINQFYDDYSPIYYRRHFTNFFNNSFRRYYSNPHNTIFSGGVEYTPDAMNDIYQHPIEEVFYSVIEVGSHGPELYSIVPAMNPSPMQIVIEKRDSIVKNIQTYINRSKIKSHQAGYSILKFK